MFHVPPLWHDDLAPLYMLGRVMSARTAKMYLDMVLKDDVATSVMAMASNSMYDGAFDVSATAKEIKNETKIPMDQLEKRLWTYLEDAKANPVDPQLLQRVKNSVEAQLPPEPCGHGHRRLAGADGDGLPLAVHRGAVQAAHGGHRRGHDARGEEVPDEGQQRHGRPRA